MKIFIIVLITIILILIIIHLFALMLHNQMFKKRCDDTLLLKYFSTIDYPNIRDEKTEFISNENKLNGHFYSYNDNNKALIILAHGMYGGHKSYFKEIEYFLSLGYLVFAYDNTATFDSEGKSLNGFTQSLIDLNNALNFVKTTKYKDLNIFVFGHSWGAFATLNIINYHKDIKGIIAMSGFLSLKSLFKGVFKGIKKILYPSFILIEKLKFKEYYKTNALNYLKDTKVNSFILFSDNDNQLECKYNYEPIFKLNNPKIKTYLGHNKFHNVNYTTNALAYSSNVMKTFKEKIKNKELVTYEDKKEYFKDIDFDLMSELDLEVMNKINEFIISSLEE